MEKLRKLIEDVMNLDRKGKVIVLLLTVVIASVFAYLLHQYGGEDRWFRI